MVSTQLGNFMTNSSTDQLRSLSIDRNAEAPRQGFWPLAGVGLLGAVIAAGLMWGFMNQQLKTATAEAEQAVIAAETNPSTATGIHPVVPRASGLVASGYVVARRQATVSAEITGLIREITFEEGTRIAQGETLAVLDDARARLTLRQLLAVTESSKRSVQSLAAQIVEAKIVFERAEILANKAIGTRAAVSAAEAALVSLNAQLEGAKANIQANQALVASQRDLIERHVIRAPFSGVVIAKNAQVGEILSPSSAGGGFTRTGIATLVDMQSLEIEVDVNEGQIGRITPNQSVEAILDAYQDWKIPAKVVAIIPTADRARATIKVRVSFDAFDERVLPDMAAKVTFIE